MSFLKTDSKTVLNIEKLNSIEPFILEKYLKERGWDEQQKIDDRAIILSINQKSKKYSILLPLDQEIPDFEDRMEEALKTLEFIEQRPISEILANVINPSKIAIQKQREIFSLKFKFLEDKKKKEIPAKKIGSVLLSLQDLFDAIGQNKLGRESNSGKTSKDITEKTELSLFETFKGSFGLKLALAPEKQLPLFEERLSQKISESFLKLIKNSNQADKGILKEQLIGLKRKSASRYRKFLMSLVSSQADLYVEWGSVDPEKGGQAELHYSKAIEVVDFINKMEVEEPEEFKVIGELIAANKSKKTFEIEDKATKEKYAGKILENILLNSSIELTIGKTYSTTIQQISSINSATGEEKIEQTIIDIIQI